MWKASPGLSVWSRTVFGGHEKAIRVRCYLPARDDEPECRMDFQMSGWHLYLLEDIDTIEAAAAPFEPRAYRRTDEDVSITIRREQSAGAASSSRRGRLAVQWTVSKSRAIESGTSSTIPDVAMH